jgi:hypothetical protein
MNIILEKDEREALLSLLTEQQSFFIREHVKRSKKTVFANEMARDKGIILPEDVSIEHLELLLDEWILEDYIDNGFVNPDTPCECGRPLRFQYIVKHKSTNEVRRFGITHFEEHTGIPAEIVNAIKKGFTSIDYEMDELLTKVREDWQLQNIGIFIPSDFPYPTDIQSHLDHKVPLLDRQIKRLKSQINQFLTEQDHIRTELSQVKEVEVVVKSETFEEDAQVTFDFDFDFGFETIETSEDKNKFSLPSASKLPETTLSGPINDEILKYLKTVSSTRIICELLIKNQLVSKKRYITEKPKIYPTVCLFSKNSSPKTPYTSKKKTASWIDTINLGSDWVSTSAFLTCALF